ncbi:MAG: peptidoglycan-binding protein [Candidatus Omnitrophota bacterium]
MSRRLILCAILLFFMVCTAGCASTTTRTGKENQLQSQVEQLKNEVAALEAQIRSQTQEFNNLKDEFSSVEKEKEGLAFELAKKKIIGEVQTRPDTRQIKVALMNAGYSPGPISMNMDKETVEAIKSFQKDNNLLADGVMGKKTWAILKKYLYEKKK